MRKDEFTLQTFHRLINDLVSLAAAATTPSHGIYVILKAWTLAYETLWEKHGIPSAAISELQGVAWMHAETDLIPKLKTVVGEFPKDLELGDL